MGVEEYVSKANTIIAKLAPGAQAATWTSADIVVDGSEELLVSFDLSAVVGTSAQLVLDVKLPDGTYVPGVKSLTALTAAGQQLLTVKAATLPADASPLFFLSAALGGTVRFRVVLVGTSMTFEIDVQGK